MDRALAWAHSGKRSCLDPHIVKPGVGTDSAFQWGLLPDNCWGTPLGRSFAMSESSAAAQKAAMADVPKEETAKSEESAASPPRLGLVDAAHAAADTWKEDEDSWIRKIFEYCNDLFGTRPPQQAEIDAHEVIV